MCLFETYKRRTIVYELANDFSSTVKGRNSPGRTFEKNKQCLSKYIWQGTLRLTWIHHNFGPTSPSDHVIIHSFFYVSQCTRESYYN